MTKSARVGVVLVLGILLAIPVVADSNGIEKCPFTRGFNLGQWFDGWSANEISNAYTITDLEHMRALGADHVRVPIDLYHLSGNGPDYRIDPILLMYLDRLVDWCEALGLYVILDNHSLVALDSDPEREARIPAIWSQMASHFVDRSDLVLYEILNEPIGIPTWEWGRIQQEAITAIRAIDKTHTILVSPGEYGRYDQLHELPWYADENLIYTFHFYDPFLFTHQGADWVVPSMEQLRGVPYPYSASQMPAMPPSFAGTWLGQLWEWYDDAGTPLSIADRMSIPVQFSTRRNVPIHCGELGVYQAGADPEERAQWYTDVRTQFDANDIAWTLWGYRGYFGIYEKDSPGAFPDDLDTAVVEALGLIVPTAPVIRADTADLVIYDDLVSGYLFDGGHSGTLDLHSSDEPAEGIHCLHWTGASQYTTISWRFTTPRDLSLLLEQGYRIRLRVKTDTPSLRFDVRFVDTDQGDNDRPWRMVKTIDRNLVPMDGQWHEVEFGLDDMIDAGTYHNGSWHGSANAFDWTRIDRMEIVADHHSMVGMNLWLDDVQIIAP